MFVNEGLYSGAIIKFAIYVPSGYPLAGVPSLKILSPSNISLLHPVINMDNKLPLVWGPDGTLFTILEQLRDLFVKFKPTKEQGHVLMEQISSSVSTLFSSQDKDIFSPCKPSWTPELLSVKRRIMKENGEPPNNFTEIDALELGLELPIF
eukprot:TRINITY_DN1265_c0_g2_i6.p1 TRINITY_DN1265_c0_g2~~TRINITY_DN1265_c0_g2_i6.p1  ORF type:complete len:151 (+),score=31.84 TRINITY_DN1265_c0_g2_i6:274-726(+)